MSETIPNVKLEEVPAIVENVHINGVKRTKDSFIRHQVRQLFLVRSFEELLEKSQEVKSNLQQLSIFNEIVLLVDVAKGDKSPKSSRYDITYFVKEKKPYNYGIHTMCGLDNKVNVVLSGKCVNMFGRAEQLEVDYQYGLNAPSSRYASFVKPLERNPRIKFGLGVYDSNSEHSWSKFLEKTTGLFAEVRFPTLIGTHQVRWEGSWREIGATGRETPLSIREESGHSIKNALRHVFERDTRDDSVFPSRGLFLRLTQEVAGFGALVKGNQPPPGSMDPIHVMHQGEMRTSFQLPFGGIVAEACLGAGLIKAVGGPQSKVSIADRFFLGGPMDVRGFRMRCIGPCTEPGPVVCPLGSEAYYLTGLHLYSPLPFVGTSGFADLFRLHGFVMAGNTADMGGFQWPADPLLSRNTLNSLVKDVRLSAGVGLIFKLAGIARIELNYCFPLRAKTGDQIEPGLQFGIGITYM